MGKLPQGAFQGFIGKTGGLVGKRWKGKYIVSQYQPIVANPKSLKQSEQRELFKKALEIVTNFMDSSMRLSLSSGFVGTTVFASNIGFVARMIRQIFYSEAHAEVKRPLDYIQRGTMTSGMDNFGNTILDMLELVQAGTTANFDIQFGTSTGVKYFGSDQPLEGLKAIVCSNISGGGLSYTEIDLGIDPEATNVDLPKAFGFQDDASECGNWPFVYKANLNSPMASANSTSILSNIKGEGIHECFANVGFYINQSTVYTSRWLYKTITVV